MSQSTHVFRTSRQGVLDRIRSRSLSPVQLPYIDSQRLVSYQDPVAQFTTIAEAIGATVTSIDCLEQVAERLSEVETFTAATRVASLVPEAVAGTVNIEQVDDPHTLADLDWVVARGAFGVAENGAIWVPESNLPHRVMLFIPQYLALIVPRNQIVSNLHAAYERSDGPRIAGQEKQFGTFVAGPSKTADIEQSLVLGAHGCRTLHIFLLAD